MFISNIISKPSAIIYKARIIYKATTVLTNKDQHPSTTNINTSFIKFLYTTCSHTHTWQQTCISFSLLLIQVLLSIYLFFFPDIYSYLKVRIFYFVGLPSYQRYFSKSNVLRSNISNFICDVMLIIFFI